MCVHNCWFLPTWKRYKFISYFFSRVMLVGGWLVGLCCQAIFLNCLTVLFHSGFDKKEWAKLLKINIYLNPLSKYFPFFQTPTFHKSLIFSSDFLSFSFLYFFARVPKENLLFILFTLDRFVGDGISFLCEGFFTMFIFASFPFTKFFLWRSN